MRPTPSSAVPRPRHSRRQQRRWNMAATSMNLKLLLPFQIFAEVRGVSRLVAETRGGSFGLLPQRLDCVAALTPGILIYETAADGEVFVAVDEGVLVKTGAQVLISVRRALRGSDLPQLRGGGGQGVLIPGENEEGAGSV